ncbi:DsbA family protein [Primorskyibacter sp. S187A]|uniref:DsbA family protein n=1 Tax=Primorskyibacter sp. S187A TaxID=3415130 RepID=UPI003C7E6041
MSKWMPIVAAAVAVAGLGGWYVTSQNTTGASNLPTEIGFGAANAQESSGDVDTSGIVEMVQGADDAPVTIIEYASYTCPHCADFHAGTYKQLKADYIDTGKVKFIYREVFFDRYGLWASMVARCGGPERFFGISDLIYQGQSTWARAGEPAAIADELRKIGRLAGLGQEELQACLTDGDKAQALVAWYEANAQADGIRSTPSFIIDGQLYSNMSYSEFQRVIDGKLDG